VSIETKVKFSLQRYMYTPNTRSKICTSFGDEIFRKITIGLHIYNALIMHSFYLLRKTNPKTSNEPSNFSRKYFWFSQELRFKIVVMDPKIPLCSNEVSVCLCLQTDQRYGPLRMGNLPKPPSREANSSVLFHTPSSPPAVSIPDSYCHPSCLFESHPEGLKCL
jgi:hypothetical protein